jgi:hypothetical protein
VAQWSPMDLAARYFGVLQAQCLRLTRRAGPLSWLLPPLPPLISANADPAAQHMEATIPGERGGGSPVLAAVTARER